VAVHPAPLSQPVKIHPSDLLLEGLLASPDSEIEVTQHLARCGRCQQRLAAMRRQSVARSQSQRFGSQGRRVDYDVIFSRAESRWQHLWASYEMERQTSSRLFSELMSLPPARQELVLSQHPRFRTWGLAEHLLVKTQEAALRDPLRSERLAYLTLGLCDGLAHQDYGRAQVEDLKARGWALLGNARRIQAELDPAEEAFESAFRHLRQGTGEPLERALLLDLKTSLLRARRRFDDAIRASQLSISGFREIGDLHRAARSLINLSTVYEHAGSSDRAITCLGQASLWIDPKREPRLFLQLHHNLVTCLTNVGRVMEAQRLFARTQPLYRRFSEPSVDGRRRWIQARIASRLGQEDQAEDLLHAACAVFTLQGASFDVALVGLELGSLYAHQGRSEDLRDIGQELVRFFSSRHIDREERAVMELLK